tara:strand:+ start:63 stop:782 length:720 start_codon:yes stop_codon:yes gene_type:complete
MVKNPFPPFKDRHLGQDAIIFGSGPTILDFDASLISDDVVKFGVNDQIFLDLDLDYWFMGDAMPQEPKKFYDRIGEYQKYTPKIQKFVRVCTWDTENWTEIPGYGKVPRNGQLPKIKGSKQYVADNHHNPDTCRFTDDIGEGNISAAASIIFEVLQFALYCGVKRIYLVGQDCNYQSGTFAKFMIGKSQNAGHWILRYWKVVKPWLTENHPDVEVYSVNPVALDIFPEIDPKDIPQKEG